MTSRIAGLIFAASVLFLGAYTAPLRGQAVASAQISGLIADPSGASIPGATITATQTDTRLARTTVSGADGTYLLPNLPAGPYRLAGDLPSVTMGEHFRPCGEHTR